MTSYIPETNNAFYKSLEKAQVPVEALNTYQKLTQFFYSAVLRSISSKHLLGWESVQTQVTRFDVLIESVPKYFSVDKDFIIFDAGCGYGKLYEHLISKNIFWNYIGVDTIQECIDEARTLYYKHAKNSVEFICKSILEPNFDRIWNSKNQYCDVSFMSGMLNLNIGKVLGSHANYDLVLFVIRKLLLHSKQGCVCNFLHNKAPSQDDTFIYYDPKVLRAFLLKNSIEVIEIREDYLPNDFTLIIKK